MDSECSGQLCSPRSRYGSGYPEYSGLGVQNRDLPFYFWPVVWHWPPAEGGSIAGGAAGGAVGSAVGSATDDVYVPAIEASNQKFPAVECRTL